MSTPPIDAELQQLLQLQRDAALLQPYPSYAQRQDRLARLQRLLELQGESLAEAICADFGQRSMVQTRMAELLVLQQELRHARRQLGRWMRMRRVRTGWAFWPAGNRLLPQPLGVVGIVSPWNYPLQLALSPALGALAAGNRVMIKPSESTPLFAEALHQAVARLFDPAELAVVTGDADVGRAFAGLPFDHLMFTGSTHVGRQVAEVAARQLVPVTLELGGKSPALIDLSADMALAARRIAHGKLLNAGQTCVAPDHVLVHRSQLAAFVSHYRQAVQELYPGLPANPDYCAIINARQFQRQISLLQQAHEAGCQIEVLAETDMQRRLLGPSLVLEPAPELRLMQEEIFGPILPVLVYDQPEQVLQQLRQQPRPLALYWFGQDRQMQQQVLRETHAGSVGINDCIWQVAQLHQPFGGIGPSGQGAYRGVWSFRRFSHEKPVFLQSRWSGTRMLYPPYGPRVEQLLDLLKRWS